MMTLLGAAFVAACFAIGFVAARRCTCPVCA
jgi:hypothetical protein